VGKRVQDTKRPLIKSARLWVPTGLLLLLVVGGGLLALNLVPKGLAVRSELEAALPLASRVQAEILAGDAQAASSTTSELKRHTENARAETKGRVWSVMEKSPFIGANLEALRVISETVDDLAADALVPASAISIDSLKPVDGRFDVAALQELGGLLATAIESVDAATKRLDGLEQNALVPQLSAGVEKLSSTLEKARPVLSNLQQPLSVLPEALGASGSRNYLMIFQGNSEMRASGGNPAAMTMLNVNDGLITITQQTSSGDFLNNRPESVAPLDAETLAIYTDMVGKWIPNITATPHFPTTVQLMRAYWAEEFGSATPIDGVISFDPVGLSYLLAATGPVVLPTGEELTAENAVPLLLNGVYFKYETSPEHDRFFAASAVSVFDALRAGTGDTGLLLSALAQSVGEGRLKVWSSRAEEASLLAGAKMDGMLPTNNSVETTVGVYFNDTTSSKMDYYVDASVGLSAGSCLTDGGAELDATVNLKNSITREEAADLPVYITGRHFQPGFVATDALLYGPIGASIDSWLVNGKEYLALSQGTHLGRPVVRLNYVLAPGESVAISYKLTTAPNMSHGPLELHTTPMVRPTPVDIVERACKE
jgi:hypothetical protein